MNEDKYLLDISTSKEREKIRIDNVLCELASPEDFEMSEFLEIASKSKSVSALLDGEYTADSGAKLDGVLDELARKVLKDIPDEVYSKLRAYHKLSIIRVFSDAVERAGEGPRPNGRLSSPDSKDSTAGAPQTG